MKKRCSRCKKLKNKERDFHRNKWKKDSRHHTCKSCRSKFDKTRNDPEYQKEYREKNKEVLKKAHKVYHKLHRDKIIAKVIKWNRDNPKKRSLIRSRYKHRRRDLERKLPATLTDDEWNRILEIQKNSCAKCKTNFEIIKPTIDHIVPVTKGGGLIMDNIQALCGRCNSRKSTRIIDYRS